MHPEAFNHKFTVDCICNCSRILSHR